MLYDLAQEPGDGRQAWYDGPDVDKLLNEFSSRQRKRLWHRRGEPEPETETETEF
jgi:hypothetical protein